MITLSSFNHDKTAQLITKARFEQIAEAWEVGPCSLDSSRLSIYDSLLKMNKKSISRFSFFALPKSELDAVRDTHSC